MPGVSIEHPRTQQGLWHTAKLRNDLRTQWAAYGWLDWSWLNRSAPRTHRFCLWGRRSGWIQIGSAADRVHCRVAARYALYLRFRTVVLQWIKISQRPHFIVPRGQGSTAAKLAAEALVRWTQLQDAYRA